MPFKVDIHNLLSSYDTCMYKVLFLRSPKNIFLTKVIINNTFSQYNITFYFL